MINEIPIDDFGNIELDTPENFKTSVQNDKSNSCLTKLRNIFVRNAINLP